MAIGSQDISLVIQISADQKSLIEEAAALSGQPIASFTKQAEDGDIDPQGRWRELAFRRHGDAMRQLTGPDSDG